MKTEQEKPRFEPITITLETEEEAESFLRLIDGSLSLSSDDTYLQEMIYDTFSCNVVY